jgi:flagellar assembly protein FliH
MIRVPDLFGSSLPRWQFPELELKAEPAAVAAPPAGEAEPVAEPRDQADAGSKGAGDDPGAGGDAVSDEIARGYAEGFHRGLAEGGEKGYASGYIAGLQAAEQSLAAEARRVAAIVEHLNAPMPAVDRVIEDALLGLALELARYVIGSEISRSRDSLVRLIREALAKAPVRIGGLRIALNPEDLDLVRALGPDIEGGGAMLVGDTGIEAGGCLIVVNDGDGPVKDRRWHPRAAEGAPHIDLSLAARWRSAMLALFDGEGK